MPAADSLLERLAGRSVLIGGGVPGFTTASTAASQTPRSVSRTAAVSPAETATRARQ